MFEGSVHAQKGVVCVDCHMSKMANRAGATQKIPKEPWDVTAHTMRVVTPEEADVFKMRSSCDKCHKDVDRATKGTQLIEARQVVLDKVNKMQEMAMKSTSVTSYAVNSGLNLVLMDGSLGAHNPQKAINLLQLKK